MYASLDAKSSLAYNKIVGTGPSALGMFVRPDTQRFPPDDKSAMGALSGNGVVGGVVLLVSWTTHDLSRKSSSSLRTAGLMWSYQTFSPVCHFRKIAQQQ